MYGSITQLRKHIFLQLGPLLVTSRFGLHLGFHCVPLARNGLESVFPSFYLLLLFSSLVLLRVLTKRDGSFGLIPHLPGISQGNQWIDSEGKYLLSAGISISHPPVLSSLLHMEVQATAIRMFEPVSFTVVLESFDRDISQWHCQKNLLVPRALYQKYQHRCQQKFATPCSSLKAVEAKKILDSQ